MSRPINKENLMSLADQVVWAIENYVGTGVENIPQSMGTLYYVSNTDGDNSNDGLSPNNAKATIGNAILTCGVGDIIIVEAGTYPEDVNINKNSVELWCEIGTIITAQSGVGLTVSGSYCKVITPNGALLVNPVATGTAVLVSGGFNYIWDIRVPCASSGNLGFEFTGSGIHGTNLRCADPLVAAFKVSGDKVKLELCCTGGTPVDTSIGFWITATADKTRLRDCASQGHASGGYVVDTGATNGEAINCVSGGGDGPKLDPSHAFAWNEYSYDDEVAKDITFADAPTTYNIFKITGIVRVTDLYGIVETVIPNTASDIHLEVFSAGAPAVDISNNVGAPDLANLPVKSLIMRIGDSDEALETGSSLTPSIIEYSSKDPQIPIVIVADASEITYIRLNITAALASGKIHWHCHYEPLSDGGFVEAA